MEMENLMRFLDHFKDQFQIQWINQLIVLILVIKGQELLQYKHLHNFFNKNQILLSV